MDGEDKVLLIIVIVFLFGLFGTITGCDVRAARLTRDMAEKGYCQTTAPGTATLIWAKCKE